MNTIEIVKPNIKLSANVSQLFDVMSNQHGFAMKGDFEESFDFYIRCSLAEIDGGEVTKQFYDFKDVTNKEHWNRLAKRLFQHYAFITFDIKRDKLMKEFIDNLTIEQNEWIQQKIVVMVKDYFAD